MRFNSTSTVTGTLGERRACTVDESGQAHIMSLLSNIYGQSKAAVLREYAANGYDSHLAAGISLPVEITLPTPLNPVLTISDYGLGLTLDGIENVYSKYGASTKRDNNDEIGGFGIGAKSAFSVASQFTVDAVRDGEHTIAVFSMDDGVPGWTVVSHGDTKRGNGVTVQIPVDTNECAEWEEEAAEVFRTWAKGSVLVNGEPPVSIFDSATKIVDGLHWSAEWLNQQFLVTVGGVSYTGNYALIHRLDAEYRTMLSHRRAIISLPIGSVDISPNRETLRDTSRTINALNTALSGCVDAIKANVAAELEAATTDVDKVLVWVENSKRYSFLTIPAPDVPEYVTVAGQMVTGGDRTRTSSQYGARLGHTDVARHIKTTMVVTGDMDGRARRLLPRWRKHHDWATVILTNETDFDWLPVARFENVVTVEQMVEEARDLPPVKPSASRGPRTINYTVHRNGATSNVLVEDIADEHTEESLFFGTSTDALRLSEFGMDGAACIELRGSQSYDLAVKRIGFTPQSASVKLAELREAFRASVTDEQLAAIPNRQFLARHRYAIESIRERASGKLIELFDRLEESADIDPAIIERIHGAGIEVPETDMVTSTNPTLAFVLRNLGWRNTLDDDLLTHLVLTFD